MEIYDFNSLLKSGLKKDIPCAVAIGVFDLVHLGHQQVFTTLSEFSSLHDSVETMVITFNRNPKGSKNIDTLRLREKYLAQFEINSLVLIDFSAEFGKLSASDFIQLLLQLCDLKAIVVGEDFHCGNLKASCSAFDLKELCSTLGKDVNVIIKSPVLDCNGVKISSSLLREYISLGELEPVLRFTLRPYQVDLAPIPSILFGTRLRILLKDVMQLLPPPGLYDGELVFKDEKKYPCFCLIDEEQMILEFKSSDISSLPPIENNEYLNLFCRSQQ